MIDSLENVRGLTRDEARLAQMLKALGNPVRFRIMQYLAEKQLCITGDIVEFTEMAQSTISQHLKVLREAGLIRGEIEGPATNYCVNPDGVLWLKEQIGSWLPDCCRDMSIESLKSSSSKSSDAESGKSCCS
jgi:ArsR family transcriptional regulator, arsenate/arsenite/antimonite-responsive transcriptional repressor